MTMQTSLLTPGRAASPGPFADTFTPLPERRRPRDVTIARPRCVSAENAGMLFCQRLAGRLPVERPR